MRLAADFRSLAREALKGKWKIAILVGLVATILGVSNNSLGPELKFNFEGGNASAAVEIAGQTIFSTSNQTVSNIFLTTGLMYIGAAALIIGIALFMLASVVSIGYAYFNLNLVDGEEVSFNNLFDYLSDWKRAIIANILQVIYTFLWTLLLIIPGIIASLSYSMTNYILAENPELTANEAITRSKEMMDGNKWRLFCLNFSFIGWDILAMFTFGIGNLWLNPYKEAAKAAFYREVSGTEQKESETIVY